MVTADSFAFTSVPYSFVRQHHGYYVSANYPEYRFKDQDEAGDFLNNHVVPDQTGRYPDVTDSPYEYRTLTDGTFGLFDKVTNHQLGVATFGADGERKAWRPTIYHSEAEAALSIEEKTRVFANLNPDHYAPK